MDSVTNGGPKELLEIGGRSLLERALDEAASADERLIVWSKRKGGLWLEGAETVLQPKPRGLGDAVRVALKGRSEVAVVLLPDVVYVPASPLPRLLKAVQEGAAFALAVERVPDELVSRYGIAEFDEATGAISRLVEKPDPSETPSRWAVSSRYAFDRFTTAAIGVAPPADEEDELQLIDLLRPHLRRGAVALPLAANERRYDCGSPEGYARAVAEIG